MAVAGMDVPLQTPAVADVAVVFSQPEVQRAGEARNERDVGERAAHEVVAAVRGPVDHVVQVGHNRHTVRLPPTLCAQVGETRAYDRRTGLALSLGPRRKGD